MPTKPLRSLPPRLSMSVCACLPSDKVTVCARCSRPIEPENSKKLPRRTSIVPPARTSMPLLPGMSKVRLLPVPVVTR